MYMSGEIFGWQNRISPNRCHNEVHGLHCMYSYLEVVDLVELLLEEWLTRQLVVEAGEW